MFLGVLNTWKSNEKQGPKDAWRKGKNNESSGIKWGGVRGGGIEKPQGGYPQFWIALFEVFMNNLNADLVYAVLDGGEQSNDPIEMTGSEYIAPILIA